MRDISLRDYQQEAKRQIFYQWDTVDSLLFQMPTGTGKTRLFTSIIRDINIWGLRNGCKKNILIIAHRSELILQIHRSLGRYHVSHGIIDGSHKEQRDLKQLVQVASIQTITHPSNYYITHNIKFDFIIIDEAHHALAKSYKKLWTLYPNSKILGVTATPWRMDKKGFKALFDSFIPSMQIKIFIEHGWLATYQYYSILPTSSIIQSINSIREFDVDGDYKSSALEREIDKEHIRAQLLNSYLKYAAGKKGIIYSISREHSDNICSKYQSADLKIVSIDSTTPIRKREMLIDDFKKGKLDIIVNVDIFSEGFDCPDIEFIQLARPTKSLVKYIQQVGRGLRKYNDKKCIILDNVGLYNYFGLPDDDRPWEEYYNGDDENDSSIKNKSNTTTQNETTRVKELSEGNDNMFLIQDIASPQKKNNNTITEKSLITTDEKPIGITHNRHFEIKSKSFYKGRYRIVENENGYYICNTGNDKQSFLEKYPSYPIGDILIQKQDENKYVIVRALQGASSRLGRQIIIGFLLFQGKLIKYSSFNQPSISTTVIF